MAGPRKRAHRNIVVVVGAVVRDAEVRVLADGVEVAEVDVRVALDGAPAATVPVRCAAAAGASLVAGDEVVVVGAVRRRFFRTGGATVSRTDVLADAVLPAGSSKRVSAVLAAAAERLVA